MSFKENSLIANCGSGYLMMGNHAHKKWAKQGYPIV